MGMNLTCPGCSQPVRVNPLTSRVEPHRLWGEDSACPAEGSLATARMWLAPTATTEG